MSSINKVELERWDGYVMEIAEDGDTFIARLYKDFNTPTEEILEAEIWTSHLAEPELEWVEPGARFTWSFYGDDEDATSEIVFDKRVWTEGEWQAMLAEAREHVRWLRKQGWFDEYDKELERINGARLNASCSTEATPTHEEGN
jgi:hypothetical protein